MNKVKALTDIDLRSLANSFAKATPAYDQYAFIQQTVGRELIDRLDCLKLQPRRILDIGSGTGFCTTQLQNKYPDAEIVALDIALPMLQFAKEKCGEQRLPHYLCADANHLPFANESFDLIFSNLTLQWFPRLT